MTFSFLFVLVALSFSSSGLGVLKIMFYILFITPLVISPIYILAFHRVGKTKLGVIMTVLMFSLIPVVIAIISIESIRRSYFGTLGAVAYFILCPGFNVISIIAIRHYSRLLNKRNSQTYGAL